MQYCTVVISLREYYRVFVLLHYVVSLLPACEELRVGRHGIVFGMMNRNSPKVVRRRVQQLLGKNPFYVTATFYTPQMLIEKINTALKGRSYSIEWTCTGLQMKMVSKM
jgi:hypothetical protein